MINLKALLRCVDSTGAQVVECITVLGKKSLHHAKVGDKIVCVVKQVKPATGNNTNLVKKGEVCHGVILRTKYGTPPRKNGMTVKFSDNAVALINKNTGEPLGQKYDQNSNLIAKEVEKYFPKMAAVTDKRI
ncbi:hypothetical protein ACO0OL_001720 [Hanseniaspora opuntiae]|jgi:ribosomal protein L14|uniref:54S ribosomal protein L38, mitochondrial n=1 Tax=Hanseniaspora opuntiae TaxID=211096 RepID=A0A1E5RW58_9ASCO|nr:54S ribosomal protein L38, mitochondrial [Hanseniaspora opuntiae]